MDRISLLLGGMALALVGCAGVLLGRSASPKSATLLECERPFLDLGTLRQGASNALRFELRNTGTRSITITDVRSDCDCLVADSVGKTIEAGERLELAATWKIHRVAGAQTRNLHVLYRTASAAVNADAPPRQEELWLQAVANVTPDYSVQPLRLIFDLRGKGDRAPLTERVQLTWDAGEAYPIEAAQVNHPAFRATPTADGIEVRLDPASWTRGEHPQIGLSFDVAAPHMKRSAVRIYVDE